MNLAELRQLAAQVGFPDASLDVAAAVAMAESGGNPAAVGDQGNSLGLWQVNVPSHPQYKGTDLLMPEQNARAALTISKGGTDWSPWSTFTTKDPTKSYKRFLPAGPPSPAMPVGPDTPAVIVTADAMSAAEQLLLLVGVVKLLGGKW